MVKPPPTEMRQRDLGIWPRYEAATLGFRHYWYPVTWSRDIGRRPKRYDLCGEPIMLLRDGGKLYGFYDQCPHRGIPLSVGRQEFPGTWSCRYHGWTYDLATGVLKAALTDGPDSPICGKVRVRTYPVEERAGLVWVWMGGDTPTVPVEADIPDELLDPRAVLVGRITVRKGNWRLAAENGYDEGHVLFLHRYGALATLFMRMPGWLSTPGGGTADGDWLLRKPAGLGWDSEYPGLGKWPKYPFWRYQSNVFKVSVRMPGLLRVQFAKDWHFAWYVPVDAHTHRYFQIMVKHADSGLAAALFRLNYWLNRRWVEHVQFNDQDTWMVELMPDTGPERLYRPDASITAWRRMCEEARGEAPHQTAESTEAVAPGDRGMR
jgi:phenylpropionate dioxygenase-like ring-hydroxylating dioxygenase large terminal subunit